MMVARWAKLRPSTRPITSSDREIAMFSPIKDRAFHEPTFLSDEVALPRMPTRLGAIAHAKKKALTFGFAHSKQ